MSRPGAPVKLRGHLSFLVVRERPTCMICHELMAEGEPPCERCGLSVFHLSCYTTAIARSPKELAFWTSHDAAETEALARFAPFLCPGCRS